MDREGRLLLCSHPITWGLLERRLGVTSVEWRAVALRARGSRGGLSLSSGACGGGSGAAASQLHGTKAPVSTGHAVSQRPHEGPSDPWPWRLR